MSGRRILHLSWEYPPLVYGGLGRHVHALAEAQA
ncbi:MAG: glycogen/starch synthase, partial [Actinomycetota bacterium]